MNPHLNPSRYVSPARLDLLREGLSKRDWAILRLLSRHGYATTKHLQRRFFADHATPSAATRATVRVLDRLLTTHVITRLDRKIGGHTRGSASYIWHLDAAGERLTRNPGSPRRRFVDPSLPFLDHSLQVTDTAVTLYELTHSGDLRLSTLQVETSAWRTFLTRHGTTTILKPDLFATLSTAEFDDHWYLEVDRGTESLPVLLQKCRQYTAYKATGRAQAEHGVFPRVLWIVPTKRRVQRLAGAIEADPRLPNRLFTVVTPDRLAATINPTNDDETPEPRKEEP